MRSTLKITLAAVAVVTAVGCGSMKPKRSVTQEATASWNAARANVLVGLARDQYQTGNFDKCRETITEAGKLDPKNANLLILSARLAIEQGQLETAEKELSRARIADAKNAEADYLSGVVFQRWQQPQTAFEFYSSAVEKAPAELAYLMAKVEMLVAMNKSDDALTLLSSKVVYFEHSPVVRDAAGLLLSAAGRYGEAVEMFRQASMLADDDESIREHLALAFYYNAQYRESAEVLTRLFGNQSFAARADLHMAMGECQLKLHQPAEARASYEVATQLMSGSPAAWIGLAKSALEAGDPRRADLAIRKALALDAASAEANLLLGYLRLKQDRFSEALTAFRNASTLDRGDAVSLCMIGYVLERTGHADQAIEMYGRALRIRPGDDLATKLMAGVNVNE